MEILAVIPARGGSKTIPKKNLQLLNNIPLIEYTINAAKSSSINRIIVSTDDKEIQKLSNSIGVETPFLRPRKLATDSAKTVDVVKHCLDFLNKKESYIPDIIVLLQPTLPLRSSKLINSSISLLKQSKADVVLGVKHIKTHPYRSFWLKNNYLVPFKNDFLKYHQRQLFPQCFYPTGSIYVFWNKTLSKYGNIYGPKIKPFLIEDETMNIDIDTPFDLFMNEMILKYWKSYKKKFYS